MNHCCQDHDVYRMLYGRRTKRVAVEVLHPAVNQISVSQIVEFNRLASCKFETRRAAWNARTGVVCLHTIAEPLLWIRSEFTRHNPNQSPRGSTSNRFCRANRSKPLEKHRLRETILGGPPTDVWLRKSGLCFKLLRSRQTELRQCHKSAV